ncbi:SCO family protein [archaeon]|nr:MAG: SCO family protein [archaeon]
MKPLFISVDPTRDTIGQLRHYSQDFHPSITYLTGTPEQVQKVAKTYRVYFSKVTDADLDSEEEYLVDHSIVLYLNDTKGEFVEFFTQRMDSKDIIEKISQHIKKAGIASKK